MTNVCNALIKYFALNKKVQLLWMMFNEGENNNGKLKTKTDFVEMGDKTNHKCLKTV